MKITNEYVDAHQLTLMSIVYAPCESASTDNVYCTLYTIRSDRIVNMNLYGCVKRGLSAFIRLCFVHSYFDTIRSQKWQYISDAERHFIVSITRGKLYMFVIVAGKFAQLLVCWVTQCLVSSSTIFRTEFKLNLTKWPNVEISHTILQTTHV